jgi:hypothetical protein
MRVGMADVVVAQAGSDVGNVAGEESSTPANRYGVLAQRG